MCVGNVGKIHEIIFFNCWLGKQLYYSLYSQNEDRNNRYRTVI